MHRPVRVSTLQAAARDARIAGLARVPPHLRACAALRKLAMTAIGWLVLPWAVVALVLVLRLPPDPSPATTRRLLATNEPASQPAHCADDDVTRQTLPTYPLLLKLLASAPDAPESAPLRRSTRFLAWLSRLGFVRYRVVAFEKPL